MINYLWHRGYYMAARRYEISLCANEWHIFQHEKRNFVSPSGHVIFYLLCKHQWNTKPFHFRCERRDLLCNHSNGVIFTCENNVLSSRVKISRFRAKAHLVFHWCLYYKMRLLFKHYPQSVGSHRSRFMLFMCQGFCNRVYMYCISCFEAKLCDTKVRLATSRNHCVQTRMTRFKNSGIDGLSNFLAVKLRARAFGGRSSAMIWTYMKAKELKSLCRSFLLVEYSVQSLHWNTRKPISMNAYGCKQNSSSISLLAVIQLCCTGSFSRFFVRSFMLVCHAFGYRWFIQFVRLLVFLCVRSFTFLLCSAVTPFARFFLCS